MDIRITPSAGGVFTPFTISRNLAGLPGWFPLDPQSTPFPTYYPFVLANKTPDTLSVGSNEFLTGESLFLTPGPQGQRDVVRWTAPAAGTYLVQGLFQAMSPSFSAQDIAIVVQGTDLLRRNLSKAPDAAPFSFVRTLAAGEVVEFSVGWGPDSNFAFDDTILSVRITPAGSPATQAHVQPARHVRPAPHGQ